MSCFGALYHQFFVARLGSDDVVTRYEARRATPGVRPPCPSRPSLELVPT